jgi:hypothetical protein
MSPSHSNRNNPNPSGCEGASLTTPTGVVKALDALLARFPGIPKEDKALLELSLPPAPKPGAAQAEDIKARFDNLAVLVTALLHKSEASGRERESLYRQIREMHRRPHDPPASPEEPKSNSTVMNRALPSNSEVRLDTMAGVVEALDQILVHFPDVLGSEVSHWFALPAAAKPGASASGDFTARLHAISVRITDQLFNVEANGRETRYLRRLLEQSKNRRDNPPNGDGEPER